MRTLPLPGRQTRGCALLADAGLVALRFRHAGDSERINRNLAAPARRVKVPALGRGTRIGIAAKRADVIGFRIH